MKTEIAPAVEMNPLTLLEPSRLPQALQTLSSLPPLLRVGACISLVLGKFLGVIAQSDEVGHST